MLLSSIADPPAPPQPPRDATDLARAGSGFERQRRAAERERRRAESRQASAAVPDDDLAPDPGSALAATVASLSIGTPVEAQASCRHVTAAYTADD